VSNGEQPAVLILCGGRGERMDSTGTGLPKPLSRVGNKTLLWHVLKSFAVHGVRNFVLSVGYKSDAFHGFLDSLSEDWQVQLSDAGPDATKGERIFVARDLLSDQFVVTYGDGVGDINLHDLLRFHRDNAAATTVTCVPYRSPYGVIARSSDGRVVRFQEKPILDGHYVNAGYMVLERSYLDGTMDLESGLLPALASDGKLFAYLHRGLWIKADTPKELREFERAAASLPWLT
jgi:glucose-1-phosphate cytidylyltransferase